jgi:hypothetical protein
MAFPPIGRGGRRLALNQPLLQAMSRANQLLADGRPVEAAESLVQLAGRLENRGFPRRAANVRAQAARAWIQAKNQSNALDQARVALGQFLQINMPRRAAMFYLNISRSLLDNGMKDAATTMKQEFESKVKALGVIPAPAHAVRGRLPPKCPQYGAPVRSDEVEWIDAASAACGYCGSVIQTE